VNPLQEKTKTQQTSQQKSQESNPGSTVPLKPLMTAEEIAKDFKEHSVAEFFKKNRQMLGLFGKVRTLTTIVHEYATNSLDACESAGILPEIEIKVQELGEEFYEVTAKDNGPGLTKDTVGKALGQLLAGTKFHRRVQSRGQQGIGACMKGDTLVPLSDGRIIPIKEIVEKKIQGECISLDLKNLKLVSGKISKFWKIRNPFFIKINTLKGRQILLTPENPVLTINKGKLEWIRADEIIKGTKIAAPNKLNADVCWLEVKDISIEKNNEEFVYDLEIEGHHNFIAGGIVCHNSGVTMFSQTTTGKPVRVITGTGKGKAISLELTIDPKKNEPKIMSMQEIDKPFRGVAIQAKFKDVLYRVSDQGPLEYLRRTAIANPHAEITFIDPEGAKTTFKRTIKEIPKPAHPVLPHPKGVTVDELITMAKYSDSRKVSSFLKNEFDRMGDKAIEEIIKKVSFDMNKDPKKLEWAEAEEIIKCFKEIDFIAPSADSLRPIGEEQIAVSLKSIVKPEFLSVITRKPQVYRGGFPFQVEVAVAYGGEAGRQSENNKEEQKGFESIGRKIEVMRFANRAPLLFDGGGCAITKAVQTIDWRRYGIQDVENAPLTVFVNFISVYVPYTSAGKQAIADEEEVLEELRLALMDAGRKIVRYIVGKRKEKEKQEKKRMYMKYAVEVAYAVSLLTGKEKKSIEKKLLDIVLKKLKLEEQEEKRIEEESDEELEKEIEKELKKQNKEAPGKKKKKTIGEEEGEE